MHRSNNGASACASCKHQRKKCALTCMLAPFFPADKAREFHAVHRVFGVSNVTKILRNLKEEERKYAVDSLVWEAFCRQKDPVLGPYGEYRRLYEELKLYRNQYQQIHQGGNNGGGLNFVHHNNGGGLSYVHNNGGVQMVDSCQYGFSANLRQEREKNINNNSNGCVVILPQQHSVNAMNQQYCISGQYNSVDAKPMESTIWDEGP